MVKRALSVWIAILLVLAATAIGAGIYVVNVIFGDNVTFRQGGVTYALIVTSDTVRDFPRFTTAGRPVDFAYSAKDGTAPSQIIMTYLSDEAAEALDRKHRNYCESMPYSIVPVDKHLLESILGCDAPDYRIEIDFHQRNVETLVTVVFLER